MKSTIAKILVATAAAAALAGCVSEKKFNEHVASSDAAIKAAAQEAAAAKSAADAAGAAAASASSAAARPRALRTRLCRLPRLRRLAATRTARRSIARSRSRWASNRPAVYSQVREETPRQPRGVFFCGGRYRGRCSTTDARRAIGRESGTGTPVACWNARSAPAQSTSTLCPETAVLIRSVISAGSL